MDLRKRLASQTAIIFAARIFGAGAIFLAQALIARFWGADLLGEYLLIIATVNLISIFLPLGFHTVGLYFVAKYGAAENRAMLWRFLSWSYAHIVLTGIVVALICGPIATWFGGPGKIIADMAAPITLLSVATAFVYINMEVLVGLKRPLVGFCGEIMVRPILMILSFAIAATFLEKNQALEVMLWLFALGYCCVAIAQFKLVYDTVKSVPDSTPQAPSELARWWNFALPWVLIALVTDFFFDINLVILAGFMPSEDLAIFGICTRIFALIAFGINAAYAVVLPDMCEADSRKDIAVFQQRIGDANLVAIAAALILVVSVAIGGPFALMIFGEAFSLGAWPLTILSLALLVRASFGPASVVLSILDKPHACLPAVGIGIVSLVAFNVWLVPPFGLVGAALAVLAAITVWSAALWFTALRVTKIDVSVFYRLKQIFRQEPPQLTMST